MYFDEFYKIQKGALYAFYVRKNEPQHFLVGRVMRCEQDGDILIKLIAPDGAYDGLLLLKAKSIYRIEHNSIYLQKFKKREDTLEILPGETAWCALLSYAQEQKIAVQLRDWQWKRLVSGFVMQFTGQNITVQRIKKDGSLGRPCKVQRKNFCLISCGSSTEIALMHRYREVQDEKNLGKAKA